MNNNTTTAITTGRTVSTKVLLAVVAMTSGASIPAAVEAGPVEEVEQHCLSEASGSADSLERWADECRDAVDRYRSAYHGCMLAAPGTADSLERWVDHCAAVASAAADDG